MCHGWRLKLMRCLRATLQEQVYFAIDCYHVPSSSCDFVVLPLNFFAILVAQQIFSTVIWSMKPINNFLWRALSRLVTSNSNKSINPERANMSIQNFHDTSLSLISETRETLIQWCRTDRKPSHCPVPSSEGGHGFHSGTEWSHSFQDAIQRVTSISESYTTTMEATALSRKDMGPPTSIQWISLFHFELWRLFDRLVRAANCLVRTIHLSKAC